MFGFLNKFQIPKLKLKITPKFKVLHIQPSFMVPDKSRDPVLINKILEPKTTSIEQTRIVQTALCQTGGGEDERAEISSSSSSEEEEEFVVVKTLTVADTEESGQDTETSPSKSSGVEPESQQASQPLRTTKVTPEVENQPSSPESQQASQLRTTKVTPEVEPQPSSSKDFIFWSEEEPKAKKQKKGTFWVVQ